MAVGGGSEGGGGQERTNERPGTDHVISGPMRGLEKKLHPMPQTHKYTNKQTVGLIQ